MSIEYWTCLKGIDNNEIKFRPIGCRIPNNHRNKQNIFSFRSIESSYFWIQFSWFENIIFITVTWTLNVEHYFFGVVHQMNLNRRNIKSPEAMTSTSLNEKNFIFESICPSWFYGSKNRIELVTLKLGENHIKCLQICTHTRKTREGY